jgi:DNA-binding IclR family transcriptional regulator
MQNDQEPNQYAMRCVNRVASVLNYLGEHGTGTIAEIAAGTGLPRPTVFRLAEALLYHDLVTRDDNAMFHVGPRLIFLAMKGFGIFDLKAAAHRAMYRLAQETDETVALSILIGSSRMYIECVESSQPVRRVIELNKLLPLHSGASGKALLSGLSDRRVAELLEQTTLDRFTERTITYVDDLMNELHTIRQNGYATSFSERVLDGAAVAAPICSLRNNVLGAIAVLAPLHRTPKERLLAWAPLVKQAAYDIAVTCGARPVLE